MNDKSHSENCNNLKLEPLKYDKIKLNVAESLKKNPLKTSLDLYQEFSENLDEVNLLPSYSHFKKIVNNERKDNGDAPLNILIDQTKYGTLDNGIFLRGTRSFTSLIKNQYKNIVILFFCSNFQLNRLRLTEHLYIDRTFPIAPSKFKQLFVFQTRDIITQQLIPVAFFC